MTIRQVKTVARKATAAMRSAPFGLGFREVRKGRPLNYDAFPRDTNAQWFYERGRLFACTFTGKLKHGNKLNNAAIEAMSEAIRLKLVF